MRSRTSRCERPPSISTPSIVAPWASAATASIAPLDDPNYVVGELEFETSAEADACHEALRKLWRSRQAAPALIGAPRVRILEVVEHQNY